MLMMISTPDSVPLSFIIIVIHGLSLLKGRETKRMNGKSNMSAGIQCPSSSMYDVVMILFDSFIYKTSHISHLD